MLFFLRGAEYPIPTAITFAVVLIFAFAYHELAHALVADRLGDPTPRSYGRISLNPIRNLDRTGFILALVIGFGWAYTPINPLYFKGNPRRAFAIVSVAGPLANLLMAALLGLPLRLGLVPYAPPMEVLPSLYFFLTFAVYYNLLLFAFNLLPIPPLDGFRILLGILPPDIAVQLEQLYRYSMMIFLGVFFLLPMAGVDVFGQILGPVIGFFFPLFTGT
ncbi:MAG: site-2 protease family protein [Anaerolineae bacterium]|nr:site-2 protease family protein [Anaerolineae bacterium]